jgi:hypothetical protein
MGPALLDLGAAAKCSNGVHSPSHCPSFIRASRVAAEGISVSHQGDLAMSQDLHRHVRVHIKGGQQ